MMRTKRILALAVVFLGCCCARIQAQVQWDLVWSDEFNGATNAPPDSTKWAYDNPNAGSGNSELEIYCGQSGAGRSGDCSNWLQNAYLDGTGNLVIAAVERPDGQWTSARLITHGKFTFTYGRAEARMKLPVGPGLWPAFWMLGDNIFSGTNWPNCGEMDLMENVPALGPATIRSSLHGTNFSGSDALHASFTFPSGGRVDTAFHTYGVIWTTNLVQFYVDDYTQPFASFNPASIPTNGVWAFNGHPFFLLLDLAIGGSWAGLPQPSTPNPANLYVDYVRVYQPAAIPGQYEAEHAVLSGAVVAKVWSGYSGTGYVAYQKPAGDYVEWTVNSVLDGMRTARFRYANGTGMDRPLELRLNGTIISNHLSFPSTGAWNSWVTTTNPPLMLQAGTNTIRLTSIGSGGPDLDYLVVGSVANSRTGLAVRLPFGDAGGTTTSSDSSAGGVNVSLQMLNPSGVATDYHGTAGSGVLRLGRALDFSSDANGGTVGNTLTGAVARATAQPTLGWGAVTSFTATVWFKLNSMFTNTANQGGRVFILGTNGVADVGATNSLSLYYFNKSQLQFRINTNVVAVVNGSPLPTNLWQYYAIIYDGSTARIYTGSESAAASLALATNNLSTSQRLDFGNSGSLLVGNRLAADRGLDGWIQDLRFYVGSTDPNLVEDARWSAFAPSGLRAVPGNSQAVLTWNGVAGAAGYNVLRSTTNASNFVTIATSVPGTNYTDAAAINGTTYFYTVSAVDGTGSGSTSQNSALARAILPAGPAAAPAGLSATAGDTQITLNWLPSSGANSYNLKTSTTNGGPYWTLANTADTNYVDSTAVNGVTYYYVVSAVGASGESTNSNQAVAEMAPPNLGVSFAAGALTFSWASSAAPYGLYSTPSLSPPIVWSPVTNAVGSQGGVVSLSISPDGAGRFYRLVKP